MLTNPQSLLQGVKIVKVFKPLLAVISSVVLLAGCGQTPAAKTGEAANVTLNLATAGDTNMEEMQKKAVGPDFSQKYPNVSLNVVGTGPGDAGSQKIFSKLKAQKDAGKKEVDIDVAIVHQSIMKDLIENDLIEKYVPLSANKQWVTSADSKNSLGTNIEGYAIPMFHSQVAIAYNPDKVKEVPNSFEDLVKWIKAHPKRFGYNGIKNGMSGTAFFTAYVYWKTNDYKQLTEGPYDKKLEEKWPSVIQELKSLPVTYTNGNNGTLDMLNRGEIDMGPVWVDMANLWKDEGRLNPNIRLKLITPGLPGQPMYVVIPKNAKNKEWAIKYADFLTSPEIQAKVIVERNSWYPGIDPNVVLPKVTETGKNKLYKDISEDDLAKNGQSFPLAEYLKDLTTAYEKN
jgi:ABC-type uncharacterized transport system YnjBCD substrate-binding protein